MAFPPERAKRLALRAELEIDNLEAAIVNLAAAMFEAAQAGKQQVPMAILTMAIVTMAILTMAIISVTDYNDPRLLILRYTPLTALDICT